MSTLVHHDGSAQAVLERMRAFQQAASTPAPASMNRPHLEQAAQAAQSRARSAGVSVNLHLQQERPDRGFANRVVLATAAIGMAGALAAGFWLGGGDARSRASLEGEPPARQVLSESLESVHGSQGRQAASKSLSRAVTLGNVRQHLRYVSVVFEGQRVQTLDSASRVLLTKVVAKEVGLHEVGLNWRDLFGVVHAESSWVSRSGMGRNRVESHGLAQFEPGTARGMGLDNPHDPVQALVASAKLMKMGAQWVHERLNLKSMPSDKASRALSEGVTVYYNLSWKRRHGWHPDQSHALPKPTKNHINNVVTGRLIAKQLEQELQQGTVTPVPSTQMVAQAKATADRMTRHLLAPASVKDGKQSKLGKLDKANKANQVGPGVAKATRGTPMVVKHLLTPPASSSKVDKKRHAKTSPSV